MLTGFPAVDGWGETGGGQYFAEQLIHQIQVKSMSCRTEEHFLTQLLEESVRMSKVQAERERERESNREKVSAVYRLLIVLILSVLLLFSAI